MTASRELSGFDVSTYFSDGACSVPQVMTVFAASKTCHADWTSCQPGEELQWTTQCELLEYRQAVHTAFGDVRHVIVDRYNDACTAWRSACAIPADSGCYGLRAANTFFTATMHNESLQVQVFGGTCHQPVGVVTIDVSTEALATRSCVKGRRFTLAGTATRNRTMPLIGPTTERSEATKKPPATSSSGFRWSGVAAGALVALVLIALVALWLRRRRRQATSSSDRKDDVVEDNCRGQHLLPQPATHNNTKVFLDRDHELGLLRCPVEDIVRGDVLGVGGACAVWRVVLRGECVRASKRLKDPSPSRTQVMAFVDEIKLTAKLRHPRIVELVGVAWTNTADLQALFEYMEGGSLRQWLRISDERVWTAHKLQIAIDVIDSLAYVHAFMPPIVHRDIKSSNMLLDTQLRAKLSDFGSARFRSYEETMTAGVGTLLWLSPEVIVGKQDYDHRSDIFAFGVLLSELDTHELPYHEIRTTDASDASDIAIVQRVGTGELTPSFSDLCPSAVKALAQKCLAFEPRDRPTADVVYHTLVQIKRLLFP